MSSSTTNIANFPRDLLITIFLRLPINSLLHCLSVCKYFQAIIKSHDFIHLHLKHGQQRKDYTFISHYPHKKGPDEEGNPVILTKYTRNYFTFYDENFSRRCDADFSYEDSRNYVSGLGCCTGLVVVRSKYNVYFWNPAIRIYKTTNFYYRESPLTSYEFDFGIGFVPKINDFKLIRLKRDGTGPGKILHEVDVYTLGSKSWRRIQNNFSGTIQRFSTASVNGVIYWKAEVRSEGTETSSITNYILGFNLDEEVFHEINLPHNYSMFWVYEYKQSLCMSCVQGDACEIWLWKDCGTAHSWLKLHSFRDNASFFWLGENDQLLIPRKNGSFSLCDPTKKGQVKKDLPPLKNVCPPMIDRFYLKVMNYKESLVLLDEAKVDISKKRTAIPLLDEAKVDISQKRNAIPLLDEAKVVISKKRSPIPVSQGLKRLYSCFSFNHQRKR